MPTSSGSRSSAPIRQIALNAGLEGGVVAEKVTGLPEGHGLNAATGEYGDMLAAGVPDPTKVVRSALQNAASIAALFLDHRGGHRRQAREGRAHGRRPLGRHGRHGLLTGSSPAAEPRVSVSRAGRRETESAILSTNSTARPRVRPGPCCVRPAEHADVLP